MAEKKKRKDSALKRFILSRTGAKKITDAIDPKRAKRTGALGEGLGEIVGKGAKNLKRR